MRITLFMKSSSIQLILLFAVFILIFSCGDSKKTEKIDAETMVFMAHSVQSSNESEFYNGTIRINNVLAEFHGTPNNKANKKRRENLQFVMTRMEQIEKETQKICKHINGLKTSLIADANEKIKPQKLQSNSDLVVLQFAFRELKKPNSEVSFDASILKNKIEDFKTELLKLTATYEWAGREFEIKPFKVSGEVGRATLNEIHKDLSLQRNNLNPDDIEAVAEIIYSLITGKSSLEKIYPQTLIGSLSLLESLENSVLKARRLALSNWNLKVASSGDFFDKIIPIVEGPEAIKFGNNLNLEVSVAAINSYAHPILTIENNPNARISYDDEGKAQIFLKTPKVGTVVLKGTISMMNKQGTNKFQNWEKTIEVIQ
jgi:archaellum component FlaC